MQGGGLDVIEWGLGSGQSSSIVPKHFIQLTSAVEICLKLLGQKPLTVAVGNKLNLTLSAAQPLLLALSNPSLSTPVVDPR